MTEITLIQGLSIAAIVIPIGTVVVGRTLQTVYEKIRKQKTNDHPSCTCYGKNNKHHMGCAFFIPNKWQQMFVCVKPAEGWEANIKARKARIKKYYGVDM